MTVKRTHIAIYVPTLKGGGAERVMATIASKLAERGYRVDLLLARKMGHFLNDLSDEVNVVDLDKSRVLSTVWPLIRYLRIHRPTVIMSAMGHTNLITLISAVLSFRKTRVVVNERGSPTTSFPGRKISKLASTLKRFLYPKADAVVAISKGVGREMHENLNIPSELIRPIYNPVDIADIRTRANERVWHPWLEGNHQVFIAVGRLTPVKDFETLLAAFSNLAERHPRARLLVLGEGPSRDTLVKLSEDLEIDERVDFVGFQPNPYSWMAASDVYVLSSLSEGFSNSVVEAMACGLKIVSTNCEHGPPEILDNGIWGRLTPVGDAEALAKGMSEALLDQSPPNIRSRVEDFSIDEIVDQYLDILAVPSES